MSAEVPDTAKSRAAILGAIRRGLGRDGAPTRAQREAPETRLATHPRNLQPARTAGADHGGLAHLFRHYAEAVQATVTEVADMASVPAAVADYLRRENLPARAVMAPDPALDAAPWAETGMLSIRRGKPTESDEVSVTSAFAGIAETGTLVMLSGKEHPSTLNFLPETHIVVLSADRVVGTYEDVWDRIRRKMGGAVPRLPRTVNLVTGPSRSGDIQQTLLLGAHGPRRLHIVLVG
ncbi:MAG: lactate utilization protein C [Alphaproteobacteria bacterium]|nr:lactate utilization protein C [Alphaproteobacteria bacterium]